MAARHINTGLKLREGLEAPFPPYGLSIYGLSEHFEGEMEMFSVNGV